METTVFNVETMLTGLSQFDQAAVMSVNNLKTHFDVQLANLSVDFTQVADNVNASFDLVADAIGITFANMMTSINTIFIDSAISFSTSFQEAFRVVDSAMQISSANFSILFENATITIANQFILGFMAICAAAMETAALINEIISACLDKIINIIILSIDETIRQDVLLYDSLLLMLKSITDASELTAEKMQTEMLDAFKMIRGQIGFLRDAVCAELDVIMFKFSEVAETAQNKFADMQIGISEDMNIIGVNVTIGTRAVSDGFFDGFESSSKMISSISNGLNIFKNLIEIFGKTKETTSSLTQILNINTGIQATNTTATAAAGTTASSTALSVLSFGGGVLALGAGVLLAGMALALLAKTVFNFLKMSGLSTNGVKASDFDLSFAVPGLAAGGFPSAGQMFIAREAGPELVGTIGSRSAVVNNEQIVESVSRGVYDAVRAALGGRRSGAENPLEVRLYLDGKQITAAVEKVQRERGLTLSNRSLAMA